MIIGVEEVSEFTCHLEQPVDLFDKVAGVFLAEGIVVALQHKVLVDLCPFHNEEAPDLLRLRITPEKLLVLALVTIFGVIAHQELGKENAGVEALTDRLVNVFCVDVVLRRR